MINGQIEPPARVFPPLSAPVLLSATHGQSDERAVSETGPSGSASRQNCPENTCWSRVSCSSESHSTQKKMQIWISRSSPCISSQERPPSFCRTEGVPYVRKPYFLPQHYDRYKLLSTFMAVFCKVPFIQRDQSISFAGLAFLPLGSYMAEVTCQTWILPGDSLFWVSVSCNLSSRETSLWSPWAGVEFNRGAGS